MVYAGVGAGVEVLELLGGADAGGLIVDDEFLVSSGFGPVEFGTC